METWELCRKILDGSGRARFAAAVNRSPRTVYYWSSEPMSIDNPDGTEHRNLFDWLLGVRDMLYADPETRWLYHTVEHFLRREWGRPRGEAVRPVGHDKLCLETGEYCRDCGESAAELVKEGNYEAARRELMEDIARATRLVDLLDAMEEQSVLRPVPAA